MYVLSERLVRPGSPNPWKKIAKRSGYPNGIGSPPDQGLWKSLGAVGVTTCKEILKMCNPRFFGLLCAVSDPESALIASFSGFRGLQTQSVVVSSATVRSVLGWTAFNIANRAGTKSSAG